MPAAFRRDRPYHFNPRFDEETGYRTRSMLTLPMKNGRGEVIGVLQLINCKAASRGAPDERGSGRARSAAVFRSSRAAGAFARLAGRRRLRK